NNNVPVVHEEILLSPYLQHGRSRISLRNMLYLDPYFMNFCAFHQTLFSPPCVFPMRKKTQTTQEFTRLTKPCHDHVRDTSFRS
ncbi:unnamed protein product, partial [Amoebophrya sp. A25]